MKTFFLLNLAHNAVIKELISYAEPYSLETDARKNSKGLLVRAFLYQKLLLVRFQLLSCLGKSGKGGNITFKTMLVEDSPLFRKVLKDNLTNQFPSMGIIEAGDGIEMFQKIDSDLPNLIFMDIQLSGENGLELTRKIKADYPSIIVIILTDYDLPEYREAATRNKADYFFAKDEMMTDGIFKLVKSILSKKGFDSNGSKANPS